jgi:hypothetical protein
MPRSRFLGIVPLLLVCAPGARAQTVDSVPPRVQATDSLPLRAQEAESLPFSEGERFTYRIRASRLGTVGHAEMALSGPVDVRGTQTLLATFNASAGIPLFKGSDATRSWIDPKRMTSLRFAKRERRPFRSADDSVEIYPDLHRWDGAKGDSGTTVNDLPLDELSFVYFLRTVTLKPDSLYSFNQEYDSRRPPTTVRLIKHEVLTTPAGTFNTVEYEVHTVDRLNYKDKEVLHFWFSEDRCRVLVRVEGHMPILGTSSMTLETAVTPNCPSLASRGNH